MVVLSQCFSYYCCMESLGKLPPIRFGHHMADVSAILRIFSGAGRRRIQAAASNTNTNTRRAGRPRDRQRGQRVSNDSSSVFLLLGGVRRPVTRVAGVCLLCCFCVLARW